VVIIWLLQEHPLHSRQTNAERVATHISRHAGTPGQTPVTTKGSWLICREQCDLATGEAARVTSWQVARAYAFAPVKINRSAVTDEMPDALWRIQLNGSGSAGSAAAR